MRSANRKTIAMNAANILTLLRLALAPVFAWLLYTSQWLPAFVTLLIAIVTDMTDGYLARRLKEETAVGRFLDPLADKIFFGLALVVLVVKYGLPPYYLLALTRDAVIGFAAMAIVIKAEDRKTLDFTASRWGKATTTLQAITLGTILVSLFGLAIPSRIIDFLVLVTFIVSVITVVNYFTVWIRKGYI